MSEPKESFDAAIRRISVLVNDYGDEADGWAWDIIRPLLCPDPYPLYPYPPDPFWRVWSDGSLRHTEEPTGTPAG